VRDLNLTSCACLRVKSDFDTRHRHESVTEYSKTDYHDRECHLLLPNCHRHNLTWFRLVAFCLTGVLAVAGRSFECQASQSTN